MGRIERFYEKIPAYDSEFFRVAEPKEPQHSSNDLYTLLPLSPKKVYSLDEVLARLVDGSEHMEFKPDYGPEIYTG